jgi:TetR/AcrR family transcriptional regulator, mexJK operon transcriptional repressor
MMSPSGVYLRKNAKFKYDAILKSACSLFLKNGYTRTSMDAISQSANVSKQTVYSYFKNKDVLFCKMIESQCERHTPPETLLENPKLSPEEALFRIGRGFIDIIGSSRGLAIHRLVITEAERHPRIAKLFYESGPLRMQGLLARYLERIECRNLFNIPDLQAAAANFFALLKSQQHWRMLLRLKPQPTKAELDEHIRETVRMFYKIYAK